MKRSIAMLCLASLALAGLVNSASAQWPPRPPRPPRPPKVPAHLQAVFKKAPARVIDPKSLRDIKSNLCATTERAETDVRRQLESAVTAWLGEDGVARDWTPPKPLVERMIAGPVTVEPVKVKDLDVFRATVPADFSADRKREFLEIYGRQVGRKRLAVLGGILAFVLACLAAVSGYIRTDEATKGYYTNRLRLLAAAGVGATGVLVYQILT